MTDNKRIVNILDNVIDANIPEYSLLLGEYLSDLNTNLEVTSEYDWARRYQRDMREYDDSMSPGNLNVTKSVVDTVIAKMNTKRPYPFFNSTDGLQDTKQVVNDIQKFFNIYYDYQKVQRKMIDAFADACIFGIGYVYANPVTYNVETLHTYNVGFLESELRYTEPRRMLIKYRGFPVSLLKEYGIKEVKGDESDKIEYFHHYIDVNKQEQEFFINGKSVKKLPYKCDKLPIIPIYYNKPIWGSKTTSIVQELEGNQYQINCIAAKVSTCNQQWAGNTTYIMDGSNITQEDIDGSSGKVFSVKMKYGEPQPIVNVASPITDPSAMQQIEFWKNQSYETIGVSQMSAEGRIDPNVESGVMYRSVIDNESDRFSRATQQYVGAYTDLANLLIELLPEDEDVLPQTLNTSSVKWKDVKKQKELFKIQFAVVEQKSRDISEQSKYVNALLNQGLITLDEVGYYLDKPDMERAVGQISALYSGIQQCITRAIKYQDFEIPNFIHPKSLEKAVLKEMNAVYSQISDDEEKNETVEETLVRLNALREFNARRMDKYGLLEEITTVQPTEAPAEDPSVNNGEAEMAEEANPVIEDSSATEQQDLVNPEGDF